MFGRFRRKRIGRSGPAGMKPRDRHRDEKRIALEQELQGIEKALMDALFQKEIDALNSRRAEILGEMKKLR